MSYIAYHLRRLKGKICSQFQVNGLMILYFINGMLKRQKITVNHTHVLPFKDILGLNKGHGEITNNIYLCLIENLLYTSLNL